MNVLRIGARLVAPAFLVAVSLSGCSASSTGFHFVGTAPTASKVSGG